MNKVVIFGGLGNQMFQFALAISMDSLGIPTKISVNDFIFQEHYQGFELIKAFDIPVCFDDRFRVIYVSKLLRPIFVKSKLSFLSHVAKKVLYKQNKVYLEKNEFDFDTSIYSLKDSYLIGGWKSTSYFESQKSLIQEVFNFKKPTDDTNLSVSKKIESCNAVAVHIRRGNYSDPDLNQNRILLDESDYYEKAFNYIRKQVESPKFFIFSDDPDWVRLNCNKEDCFVISHNTGAKSYLDMYLMSRCKHFIIANSSFSWWPAWLSNNPEKIVVSPDSWESMDPKKSILEKDWKVIPVCAKKTELVAL